MLNKGKEDQLEEVRLIYFDKEKTLLKKYKALQKMFEEYRSDILREFNLQERIAKKLTEDKERLICEIDMAKLIICEKNLCEMAQKHYKDSIEVVNKDKLLTLGGVVQDLVEKYK